MAGASTLLILSGIQMVSSIANAYTQAEAIKAQGRWEKKIADYNAFLATRQAEKVLQRGAGEAIRVIGEGRRIEGAQRAAQGAGGIQLGFGSAEMTRAQTRALAQMDALEIRKQSYLNAWGYESQAIQYKYAGRLARLVSRQKARQTIATGVFDLFGQGVTAAYRFQQVNPVSMDQSPETIRNPGPVYFDSPNVISRSTERAYQTSLATIGGF